MTHSPACQNIRPRLSGTHDGEITGALREAVRTHLGSCDACGAELTAIARTSRMTSAAATDARPGFNARLAVKIAAAGKAEDRWTARGRLAKRLSLASAAALLAALLGLGPSLLRDFRDVSLDATDEQILDLALWGPGPDEKEGES